MSLITLVIGAVCFAGGWIARETCRPKDHPIIDGVRKLLAQKAKESKVIDVEEELKKLKGV
jgi:hypothetical protein